MRFMKTKTIVNIFPKVIGRIKSNRLTADFNKFNAFLLSGYIYEKSEYI